MEQKSSLKELLALGQLKSHRASPKEIRRLFAVVKRDLADVGVTQISLDRRFTIAYNAVLQAGRALLAAEGYRTSGQSHHATVFRAKRNIADYTGTNIASTQEVSDLLEQAHKFADLAHDFILKRHPRLLRQHQ